MKVREGFVSNSSSSSFCIIGAPIEHISKDDAEKVKWKDKHGHADYVGEYIGLNAEELLMDKTIPQASEHVQRYFKETYDIDIPLEYIGFYFDGYYDG